MWSESESRVRDVERYGLKLKQTQRCVNDARWLDANENEADGALRASPSPRRFLFSKREISKSDSPIGHDHQPPPEKTCGYQLYR
jgi:hypothetical protein